MSVLSQPYDNKAGHALRATSTHTGKVRSRLTVAQLSEIVWGATTFALFLALGPFAAIAVVFSLGSLARNQEGRSEPRAAC